MQVLECQNDRSQVELSVLLGEQSDLPDDVEQLHALDVLHEEVHRETVLEGTHEPHNEGKVDDLEDCLLLQDVFFETLFDDLWGDVQYIILTPC